MKWGAFYGTGSTLKRRKNKPCTCTSLLQFKCLLHPLLLKSQIRIKLIKLNDTFQMELESTKKNKKIQRNSEGPWRKLSGRQWFELQATSIASAVKPFSMLRVDHEKLIIKVTLNQPCSNAWSNAEEKYAMNSLDVLSNQQKVHLKKKNLTKLNKWLKMPLFVATWLLIFKTISYFHGITPAETMK